MAEWSIAHAWKACVVKSNREFESLSLRHSTEFFRKFQTIFLSLQTHCRFNLVQHGVFLFSVLLCFYFLPHFLFGAQNF